MLMVAEPDSRAAAFGQAQLVEIQRARILSGAFEVVYEQGAANVSVADIVLRAGVSRRTFYELFADREQCLVAAFDHALQAACARVLPAYEAEQAWVARLRAGLTAFLGFLDAEPKLGRLLVCDSLAGGPALMSRRVEVLARVARFVDGGRNEGKYGVAAPMLQAEGSVGGVLAILHNLLSSEHPDSYTKLAGPLTAMVAMPYLGPARAQRELDRPVAVSEPPVSEPGLVADPFKGAGMRLTYRTVRVLMAIAEQPGASNRQVANLAEIGDQGQISKLLTRLVRVELIENGVSATAQGAPNAWRLTATGRRLTDSIRAHTAAPAADGTNFTHKQKARGGNS